MFPKTSLTVHMTNVAQLEFYMNLHYNMFLEPSSTHFALPVLFKSKKEKKN